MSEKPVHSRPRRLVDWINLMGTKKVHSLIDKVYKRKNLEMAWEKVKANRGSEGVDGQNLEVFEAQLNFNSWSGCRARAERGYLSASAGTPTSHIEAGQTRQYRLLGTYRRFMTACANKPCSIGWSPSSRRYSTTLVSDIGEGDQRRMPCAKCGKRYKAGPSGSWMRISEIFSGPRTMKNSSRWLLNEVADGRVLRLIKAMLKAGSYGKGQLFPSERGTRRVVWFRPCSVTYF